MKFATTVITVLTTLLLAGTAQAGLIFDETLLDEEILGGRFFVATTGNVEATFLGSDAGYFNSLYLYSPTPSAPNTGFIFDKNTSDGAQMNLGVFTAGTELMFRLFVSNTGLDFYSGDGALNSDSQAHAVAVTTRLSNGIYFTTVGFEDLEGGGDEDYNDFMFSLSNVVDPLEPPTFVPEPSALLLLAIGLIGLSLRSRRHGYMIAHRGLK